LIYVFVNAHALEDTEVGGNEDSQVDPDIRRSRRLASMGEFKTCFEDRLRSAVTDIFTKLGTPSFAPISFELELVAHGDGAFFTRHIDTYTRGQTRDRVISGVYYFHRQPKAFSGGELRLYALAKGGQMAAFVDVQPDNDTLVCFPSWYPHEVLPVRCPSGRLEDSRFAVNCWVMRG
jgi:Rps23 Pro-64 3,4-dihydroxylase Tpa1-like proline 4-hydroxylase